MIIGNKNLKKDKISKKQKSCKIVWETIIDFTKINKQGININELINYL